MRAMLLATILSFAAALACIRAQAPGTVKTNPKDGSEVRLDSPWNVHDGLLAGRQRVRRLMRSQRTK